MLLVDVLLGVAIIVRAVTLWDRPRVGGAIVCAALSAVWWPANNRVLEGPVLLTLTTEHGFTAADVLGVVGMASAAWAIRHAPGGGVRRRDAAIVTAGIALLGAAVAYAVG